MKFIADLHIHSHFSLATGKKLTPVYLDYWARLKGVKLLGTGDITHPKWLMELQEVLEPAEQGLFKLKDKYRIPIVDVPFIDDEVRFVLSGEINSIYKEFGKTRKVHNIVLLPGFNEAEKLQRTMLQRGLNITSDGRPIVKISSREVLAMCLEVSKNSFLIPAHIWTPWFSALGERSGYDSIDECYGDLSQHIHAVEIGLSSNPAMNWMLSGLDRFTLLANSDAHSPEKIGRNANIFTCSLSYNALLQAMKESGKKGFEGTINFFPQEGKYHYAGHRICGVCVNPVEYLELRGICPVCRKKLVSGVMNRVLELSDRTDVLQRAVRHEPTYIIPLKDLLSEIYGVAPTTKKVEQEYFKLVQIFGPELFMLMHAHLKEIEKYGGELLAEAVRRMRNEEVFISEGYDGQYGAIKVFGKGKQKAVKRPLLNFDLHEYHSKAKQSPNSTQLSLL